MFPAWYVNGLGGSQSVYTQQAAVQYSTRNPLLIELIALCRGAQSRKQVNSVYQLRTLRFWLD